jgi:hypothetical protein
MKSNAWTMGVICGAVLALGLAAQAAVITAGSTTLVTGDGTTSPYSLSVYDGKASYRPFGSSTITTLGDGTLLDYRLITSTTGAFTTYAQGTGNRIAAFTAPSGNIAASAPEDSWVNLWTSNDPGTNFSTTPNYNDADITHARANRANGTIDIAGLTEGTLYFIHGNFLSQTEIVLTMSGTGQSNVVQTYLNANKLNSNRGWITAFGFENSGNLYDTISFAYRTDLDGDGSVTRGRFTGVAMYAIPEPGSGLMFLAAVTGLGLIRRKLHG